MIRFNIISGFALAVMPFTVMAFIRMEDDMLEAKVKIENQTSVAVHIENKGDEVAYIEPRHVCDETGMSKHSLFEISGNKENNTSSYSGKIEKSPPVDFEDYIQIEAKEFFAFSCDILKLYRFSESGSYSLIYNVFNVGPDGTLTEIKSNSLEIAVK